MTQKSDGVPYEAKVSRTVRSGGKSGDNIKGLPIATKYIHNKSAIQRTKRLTEKCQAQRHQPCSVDECADAVGTSVPNNKMQRI